MMQKKNNPFDLNTSANGLKLIAMCIEDMSTREGII